MEQNVVAVTCNIFSALSYFHLANGKSNVRIRQEKNAEEPVNLVAGAVRHRFRGRVPTVLVSDRAIRRRLLGLALCKDVHELIGQRLVLHPRRPQHGILRWRLR